VTYLGTSLAPDDYYRLHSDEYENPHEDAVTSLLLTFKEHIRPRILDLGCGPGQATRALQGLGYKDFVGIDRETAMVARYVRETGQPGQAGDFWGPLPKAQTAVFAHSLHLCPASRVHAVVHQLRESGVTCAIVISPLKRATLNLPVLQAATAPSGAGRKTIWGWTYSLGV
jgi:SAM-dependent methyltransferase